MGLSYIKSIGSFSTNSSLFRNKEWYIVTYFPIIGVVLVTLLTKIFIICFQTSEWKFLLWSLFRSSGTPFLSRASATVEASWFGMGTTWYGYYKIPITGSWNREQSKNITRISSVVNCFSLFFNYQLSHILPSYLWVFFKFMNIFSCYV